MDLAVLQALIEGQMSLIRAAKDAEQQVRDVVSGVGIEELAKELFPGVKGEFIQSNKHFPNPMQRAVNRYVNAVTRAELNWEWEGSGPVPEGRTPAELLRGVGRDLLQAGVVDALTAGKFAIFPYRDSVGRVRLSVLGGFLWPIFTEGNSAVVEAVLQVTQGMKQGKVRYEVRRYSPGMLEVFSDLEDWAKFATTTPKEHSQPHAVGRLPVVFRITGRDARRMPEGLAASAMPAFMDYVKAKMLMSFNSEMGSFEERAFYSDELFKLAKENPEHPVLKALAQIGPRKAKFMPSADKYERQEPIDLAGFQARAAEAAGNVEQAMNLPPSEMGKDLAAIAIQELRENYTETASSLTAVLADALTEAHDLAAAMSPTPVDAGWRVTLQPRFTQDVQAEREAIRADYVADLLSKSAALSGLQSLGVSYVTDELVQQAEAEVELAGIPVTGGS